MTRTHLFCDVASLSLATKSAALQFERPASSEVELARFLMLRRDKISDRKVAETSKHDDPSSAKWPIIFPEEKSYQLGDLMHLIPEPPHLDIWPTTP